MPVVFTGSGSGIKNETPRHLVTRELITALCSNRAPAALQPRLQLCRADVAAGAQPHRGGHLLTPTLIGNTENGDLGHVGILLEHGLDLPRIDVLAAGDDEVLDRSTRYR